jgi:dolichyl-phosphate-mannose--protein O-mannosyl transferase
LLGFLSAWLPWAFVARCQFLYLYMPSLAFATLSTAWVLEYLLTHPLRRLRMTGYAVLASIGASFLFFLPIYLGLPISTAGFYSRMWLNTWI